MEQKNNEFPERYAGDIRRYLEYCLMSDQPDVTEAMLENPQRKRRGFFTFNSIISSILKKETSKQ